ncbi:hypothetical protein DFH07DRAFT_1003564 [Mycena maculata]|uniref:SAM domain-containing protein n=1 Tax=Mycena maculata TaxID=230809 RepID=A0AAD7HNJ7_9AGAR|nr:hypothetical protein DFH07DRAFT_1003564 [Mycena maculata]
MVFIQNAVPNSPKGTRPPPLAPSNKENYLHIPPRPDYTNMDQRPSNAWLYSLNPGHIDGGVNPPAFYPSQEDIIRKMYIWNPGHPMFQPAPSTTGPTAPTATTTTTEAPVALPVPIDPALQEQTVAATPTPLELAGHQVSVIEVRPAPEKTTSTRTGKPAARKDERESKFDYIKLEDMSCCDFVTAFLKVHDCAEEYSPGVHSGPPFKMSWTGSSGGKAGAITIENDREYQLAVAALKQKNNPAVTVEYNISLMEGYRVRKRSSSVSSLSSSPFSSLPSTPCPSPKKAFPHHEAQDDDPELLYGTKVPRVDDFTPQAQLNGHMVLKLKDKWVCEKHQGEHGEPGHCYIDASGNHIGLNNRKFAMWSSSIVAGEATIHEPPNTVEFDGLRDGRITSTRPRGRGGPRPSTSSGSGGNSDATTLLLAAMLPLITNLHKPASGEPPVTPPRANTAAATPEAPKKTVAPPMSPFAEPGSELHVCLLDFLKHKKIDLLHLEMVFSELELTPDIITEVPMARLREISGMVEGRLWKFKIFCRDWTERLDEKRHAMSFRPLTDST